MAMVVTSGFMRTMNEAFPFHILSTFQSIAWWHCALLTFSLFYFPIEWCGYDSEHSQLLCPDFPRLSFCKIHTHETFRKWENKILLLVFIIGGSKPGLYYVQNVFHVIPLAFC